MAVLWVTAYRDGRTWAGVAAENSRKQLLDVSCRVRSLKFYCDVFSCRVVVHETDMAILLTPKGFEICLLQKDEFHSRAAGAPGVHHPLWATDSQSDMQRITDRLRAYDSAVFSHSRFWRGPIPTGSGSSWRTRPPPAVAHGDCRPTSGLNGASALADFVKKARSNRQTM